MVEKRLDHVLNPVVPNTNYIEELQKKLTSKADVMIEYPDYLLIALTLTSGLLIGSLLIIALNKIYRIAAGKSRS